MAWLNELVTGALLSLLAANAAGLAGQAGLRPPRACANAYARAGAVRARTPLRRTRTTGS
ncbi:MAG TPA: hypothetical protein VMA77_06905 [Solirubrobacteraceae bacterium]|nr:hypothetical protein [Solirubrobacteraceae bacterium]